jgi:hypothetical protein
VRARSRSGALSSSAACGRRDQDLAGEVFGNQLAGTCETLFPTFGDTRTAAGGGLTGDTLKCQLKPLDFASYPARFTAAQQARLQTTFPTGVCDWSKPGVDERPPLGTWLDYGP